MLWKFNYFALHHLTIFVLKLFFIEGNIYIHVFLQINLQAIYFYKIHIQK